MRTVRGIAEEPVGTTNHELPNQRFYMIVVDGYIAMFNIFPEQVFVIGSICERFTEF
jgi:hypothetical protein